MKTLFYIAVAAGAVYAASIITPDSIKNKLLASVGLLNFSVKETIVNTADRIIPKSPAERRAELIERLEQSLEEIRRAQEGSTVQPLALDTIEESEGIVKELKQENEKTKEGAVSSLVRATSEAISNIAGTNKQETCEAVK